MEFSTRYDGIVKEVSSYSKNEMEARYERIVKEFSSYMKKIASVPISGFEIDRSTSIDCYIGLLQASPDLIIEPKGPSDKPLRLPLQDVYEIGGIGTLPVPMENVASAKHPQVSTLSAFRSVGVGDGLFAAVYVVYLDKAVKVPLVLTLETSFLALSSPPVNWTHKTIEYCAYTYTSVANIQDDTDDDGDGDGDDDDCMDEDDMDDDDGYRFGDDDVEDDESWDIDEGDDGSGDDGSGDEGDDGSGEDGDDGSGGEGDDGSGDAGDDGSGDEGDDGSGDESDDDGDDEIDDVADEDGQGDSEDDEDIEVRLFRLTFDGHQHFMGSIDHLEEHGSVQELVQHVLPRLGLARYGRPDGHTFIFSDHGGSYFEIDEAMGLRWEHFVDMLRAVYVGDQYDEEVMRLEELNVVELREDHTLLHIGSVFMAGSLAELERGVSDVRAEMPREYAGCIYRAPDMFPSGLTGEEVASYHWGWEWVLKNATAIFFYF